MLYRAGSKPRALSHNYANTAIPRGQAFEPELIRQMSLALETVCRKLDLPLADNPETRLVASKIIELAQRGMKDAATLSAMTLKEFKHY